MFFVIIGSTGLPGCSGNTVAMLFERNLSSYLADMYFGIKNITGVPGCYISAATMATRELYNESLKREYLKFIFGTYVLCDNTYH